MSPKGVPRVKRPWWVIAVFVFLTGAFAPIVAAAAVVFLLLRKKWPDTLIAKVLIFAPLPAAILIIGKTGFLGSWLLVLMSASGASPEPVRITDALALVVTAVVLGPLTGAMYWRWRQYRMERSPFIGEEIKAARRSHEAIRRQKVTAWAQRNVYFGTGLKQLVAKRFAVPEGGPNGPNLGRIQDGDLDQLGTAWIKDGIVSLPMESENNRHCVVLGATGLGKTETVLGPMVEWAARQGWQIIYITCKEPPRLKDSAAPRLAAIAERYNRTFRQLSQGYTPFDPLRGSADDIRDKLVKIAEWKEEYWEHVANLLIGLALDLSAQQRKPISALPDLVFALVKTRLREMAKESHDDRVQQLVAALDDRDLGGALVRYASFAMHLRSWIAPKAAGGWSFEDADICCIELPTSTRPVAAKALMRMIMRDLNTFMSDHTRRFGHGRALVVIEEFGAVASDPILGAEAVNAIERNRTAGAYTVMTAQDPLGLGDDRSQSALLTNAVTLSYRQTTQAEAIAELAGSRMHTEGGADFDSNGTWTDQGVMRRQHTFKLNPQTLRTLGLGDAVLIARGHWAKITATMTEFGYALPSTAAVVAALDAVERSKTLAELPQANELPGEITERRPMPHQRGAEVERYEPKTYDDY